ncbi:MAG: site-2 protease family protein [Actinomycetota bacterium]|nr:site-2 protease family protein [Actinomycetota bacterium]
MFLYLFQQNPAGAVAFLLGVLVGIVVHEASHASSAYVLGDDTAYRQGRVTLNPAEHLDVLGSLMILMVGFGWGRPTPITPSKLKGKVWGQVAVAFAGPASNLFIVALCAVLFRLPAFQGQYLSIIFWYLALANGLLFIFNLIPIPPLDGSKVLYPFLPRSLDGFVSFMYQYGPTILLGLVLVSIFLPGISPLGFILGVVRPLFVLFGLPMPA